MHPGTGYIVAEDGSAMRVRADYWPDTQIRAAATQYQSSLRRTGL
jgi:S-DNA-T family DNA segregation ATPase FtsK/SpoIIIE